MMRDNYLDVSKLTTDKEVMNLFTVVANHGGVLRFVGGAVRDALKGLKGSDLNLATDLSPEELVEACSDADIKTIPLGIKQGSIGVVLKDKVVEISSLYKYVTNKDGATEIEFTDNWEEDASRRDLTINAVYTDEKGNVFDYYNGIEDLEKGYVRFIGSATGRIKEDYLRILRYFRFYSLFGVEEPNKKALEACCENRAGLKKVPMERIRDELFKLIVTPDAPRTYRLMQENGILEYILPDAEYIDDLAYFNKAVGRGIIDDEAVVKMFILYRPNEALAENMATRLKFNRQQKQLFTALAKSPFLLEQINRSDIIKRLVYKEGQEVVRAKIAAAVAREQKEFEKVCSVYNEIKTFETHIFPLKGKDILENGLAEAKEVGLMLKKLEDNWIESDFSLTKEQLLSQAKTLKKAI